MVKCVNSYYTVSGLSTLYALYICFIYMLRFYDYSNLIK